ncbi:FCD domain-containing protein [Nocardioides sp. GY 10127]|uniref:FadR/GntR family transcriptional regulator n=1 Tax=Nocardioides sp. GY 10127 TaxID=2569762 RepID=UPI001458F4B4|nr:FCD domain-containing protein [Nocardioides sp. GY 10127]
MSGPTSHHARRAVLAPLGDVSRAAQVEERLGAAIRAGLLARGERLPSEPEMAGMLGVAVVTVREALTALRGQGLVRTTRGRGGGTFVALETPGGDAGAHGRLASMTRADLHDRGTELTLLLAGCAELAAERAAPEEARALADLVPHGEEPGLWRQADAELSLSVASLTRSARLTRQVLALEADFGPLARLPLADPEVLGLTRAHHERLVDALAAGDPDAARRCTRAHWREVLARLARLHADATERSAS